MNTKINNWLGDMAILSIDDDADMQALLKKHLERMDITKVIAANSAKTALEFLEYGETNVKLIMLDLNMPDMDGVTFLQKLRHSVNDNVAGLPVIVVTAHSDERVKTGLKPFGIQGFLGKPFQAEQLQNVLEEVISSG